MNLSKKKKLKKKKKKKKKKVKMFLFFFNLGFQKLCAYVTTMRKPTTSQNYFFKKR